MAAPRSPGLDPTVPEEAPVVEPQARARRGFPYLLAWCLLAGWICVLIAVPVTGERQSTFGELQDAIAQGDVDEVRVDGALPEGRWGRGSGRATVELRWSEHGIHYVAEVIQTQGGRDRGPGPVGNRHHVHGSVSEFLARDAPSLQVSSSPATRGGWQAEFLGWHLSGLLVMVMSALFVLTVFTLMAGPEPWRANRWGWFWLILALPPVMSAAYLLFGGPTGVAPPARPAKRLRGGWAFVILLLLGGLNGSIG